MSDKYGFFDFYLEALRDALKRNPSWIQLDKIHMIEHQGSVTNGLIFFHDLFARLSVEMGLKFYIRTQEDDTTKFEVIINKKRPLDH